MADTGEEVRHVPSLYIVNTHSMSNSPAFAESRIPDKAWACVTHRYDTAICLNRQASGLAGGVGRSGNSIA